MKPIQDMRLEASGRNVVDYGGEQVATCFGTHGAEVAKAFAALPRVACLFESGEIVGNGVWHTRRCMASGRASCSQDCYVARLALIECGVDVG